MKDTDKKKRRLAYLLVLALGMMMGCNPSHTTTPVVTGYGQASSSISSCGKQALQESNFAYMACFTGNAEYGPCETCGYNPNRAGVQNANDCITCPPGFEIDVYYADCTGYCVPLNTAKKPISSNSCRPFSSCVKGPEHSPAVTTDTSVVVCEEPAGQEYAKTGRHDGALTIQCAAGAIQVTSAFYGRDTCQDQLCYSGRHKNCMPEYCTEDTCTCSAPRVLEIASSTCNGKSSCKLTASNRAFGDPCQGENKYLKLDYVCR